MKCPHCHVDMEMQTVSETKKRGFLTILFYIILLFIPIIGWIALFVLLSGSHKVHAVTYAVCPKCGRRKKR